MLDTYFEASSKKMDPPTAKSLDQISAESNKFYGKMFSKRVALDVFEVNLARVIAYGVSWALKIASFILIWRAMKTNEVSKTVGHFVSFS